MKTFIETPRLLLRPLQPQDDAGMFALDSNPNVHSYLGNRPVTTIQESRDVIALITRQYTDNGIGRWAVTDRVSTEFLGWAGLKIERNVNGREMFYDFGYRLREEFWGRGYATEAGKAWIDYGFGQMNLDVINAFVAAGNTASRRVLEKCGLRHIENFMYDGGPECWYEIRKEEMAQPNAGSSES